ncbi:UNVERIFIED_CONTAM: hypothetical protein HHA_453530 [Hammondia hammondi]|eukprot:XP_008886796.1 hypothetical protein HHA_453530 [Hammondia hammondi]
MSVEGSDGENATEAVHLEGSAVTREKPARIETQTRRGGEQRHERETLKDTRENEDSRCMDNALSFTGEDEKRGARKQRQKAASPPLTQASSSTANKNSAERDQERKEAEGCSICLRSHREGRASPSAQPRHFNREELGHQKEARECPEKERNRTHGRHEEKRLHSTQKTGEETGQSGDRTASEKNAKRQSREEQWPRESPRRHSCLQKAPECQGYKAIKDGDGGEEEARGRQRRRGREGEATRASDRVGVSPFLRHASARAFRDDPRGRREKSRRKNVDLYKHALTGEKHFHVLTNFRTPFPFLCAAGQSSDALEDALRCVVEVRRFLEDSLPRRLSSSALSKRTTCLPASVSPFWKIQNPICRDALRPHRRSSRHPSSPRSPASSAASPSLACSCSPASRAGDREGSASQLSCPTSAPAFLPTQSEASALESSLKREAGSAASPLWSSWKQTTFAVTETRACTERSPETGFRSKTRCDGSSCRSNKSEVSDRRSSPASQGPLEDSPASLRGSEKGRSLCRPSAADATTVLPERSLFCTCASLSLLPRRVRRQERDTEREAEEEARRSGREETQGRRTEDSDEASEEADVAGGERERAKNRREAGNIEAASCTCAHRSRSSAVPERGDRQVERNIEGEEKEECRGERAPEKERDGPQPDCTCQEPQKREKRASEGGREETEKVLLASSIACKAERSTCVVVDRTEWRAADGSAEVAKLRESVCVRSWKKQRERERETRETREKKRSLCLRGTGEQSDKGDVVPPCRKPSAQEVQKITER